MQDPSRPRARLVILDNDRGIVDLAAWFLERKGYAVRTASSFAEARALCAAERPDLLLSDLELGAESGAEELPRMSAAGELPPTLIVSGYLDAELAERLAELPEVLGTLLKPFDLPVLEERLEECLARARRASPPEAKRSGARPFPSVTETDADDEAWIEIRPFDPSGGTAPRSHGGTTPPRGPRAPD